LALTLPQSTMCFTPRIVTEVSAIFVDIIIFLEPCKVPGEQNKVVRLHSEKQLNSVYQQHWICNEYKTAKIKILSANSTHWS